ncbi:MAG: hypothetical protein HXS48_00775 [Theionarchaea archaeon]|jgi:hypothetical protein|nr:hypothetical protein [Theionarchaea archaeon]
MYDDLLGKRKKKTKTKIEFHVQDCDWDDENKEVIVKREFKITSDENGVVKWEDIPQLRTDEAWQCEHCGDWFTDGEEKCGDCYSS